MNKEDYFKRKQELEDINNFTTEKWNEFYDSVDGKIMYGFAMKKVSFEDGTSDYIIKILDELSTLGECKLILGYLIAVLESLTKKFENSIKDIIKNSVQQEEPKEQEKQEQEEK